MIQLAHHKVYNDDLNIRKLATVNIMKSNQSVSAIIQSITLLEEI